MAALLVASEAGAQASPNFRLESGRVVGVGDSQQQSSTAKLRLSAGEGTPVPPMQSPGFRLVLRRDLPEAVQIPTEPEIFANGFETESP